MELTGYFMAINAACVVVTAFAACIGFWRIATGQQIGLVCVAVSASAYFPALLTCTVEYSLLGRSFLEDEGWLNSFLPALAIGLLGVLLALRRTAALRALAGSQG